MNTSESRNTIFAKIETATAALKTRAPLPEYDVTITHSSRDSKAPIFGKSSAATSRQ